MPNGVSGQDLLRMAREIRPGLKAIFTSGYSEQFIRGREETDRGVLLLPKPYRRQSCSTSSAACSTPRPDASRRGGPLSHTLGATGHGGDAGARDLRQA